MVNSVSGPWGRGLLAVLRPYEQGPHHCGGDADGAFAVDQDDGLVVPVNVASVDVDRGESVIDAVQVLRVGEPPQPQDPRGAVARG
jgi:hypothetical protein